MTQHIKRLERTPELPNESMKKEVALIAKNFQPKLAINKKLLKPLIDCSPNRFSLEVFLEI